MISKDCFSDHIVVRHGSQIKLLDVKTTVVVPIDPMYKTSCDHHVSPYVFDVNGDLYLSDPVLRRVNHTSLHPPPVMTHLSEVHIDAEEEFTSDFFYTESEQSKYLNYLNFRNARTHVVNKLVENFCSRGDCGEYGGGSPSESYFNLNHLKPDLSIFDEISDLYNKVSQIGSMCSIVVLLYIIGVNLFKVVSVVRLRFGGFGWGDSVRLVRQPWLRQNSQTPQPSVPMNISINNATTAAPPNHYELAVRPSSRSNRSNRSAPSSYFSGYPCN